MKLLLDIGNSSINWASEEKSEFLSQGSFIYDKNNFENNLQKNISLTKNISEILVSNVAGLDIFTLLNCWVKKQGFLEPWQPCIDKKFKGLKTGYTKTEQMGIDRWLSMVACWERYQSSLCIVSCGTALTIDLVDSNGNHLGGYILPGIDLMQKLGISIDEAELVRCNSTGLTIYNPQNLASMIKGMKNTTITREQKIALRTKYERENNLN